jgi:hypothetical protein
VTPELMAAAAVAVLGIVGAGGWLMLRRKPGRIASPEEAATAAEGALAGFVVAGAVVGADGAGALAVSANGRVAAIARQGKTLTVEEVAWRNLRATAEGMVVEAQRLGAVALKGVDVLDIRRLAPGYAPSHRAE